MAAFTSIAKAVFRRIPQTILSATLVLVISWVVAQMGAFVVATRSDSWWCRATSPEIDSALGAEFVRLLQNFLTTWTTGYNAYDENQWVLLPLMIASILVYVLLCATIYVKFRWRSLIYVILFLYFHQSPYLYTGLSFV